MIARLSPRFALTLLCGFAGIAVASGIALGAVRIPMHDVLAMLLQTSGSINSAASEAVLLQLRLPRVILALLVGATLAVAGAMMQGLFRNPLADPGLVGVSSGAALGAVVMIVLADRMGGFSVIVGQYAVPVASLVGAWLVTWLIVRLGSARGSAGVATLLLAGIAINAFAGAIIGFCTFLATDAQLRSLSFWMLGSLGGASWETLAWVTPFCVVLLVAAPRLARALNALSLGEAEAGHLGFRPEKIKRWIILLTAAGVGGCVAQTGMIGFVGLVVPHLFRLAVGPDHRWLLPGSAVLGATLLVAADTTSRTLVAPAEMPIGIVTAAVGAPFFLFLLWQQRRRLL